SASLYHITFAGDIRRHLLCADNKIGFQANQEEQPHQQELRQAAPNRGALHSQRGVGPQRLPGCSRTIGKQKVSQEALHADWACVEIIRSQNRSNEARRLPPSELPINRSDSALTRRN